jgi:hypothetical protein
MSSVSPIGIPNALGILKNDGTGLLSWTTIQPGKNLIINGDCRVNQRVTAFTLAKDAYTWDASDLYGPDRHEGMATGTAVSAGTWGQTVTATAGHSGYAFKFAGVTVTDTGILYHRTRIEAKDAVELKNQIASFGCYVWQDTGASHNYTIYVRKANSADNFSAVTEIGHSAAQSVPSGGSAPGTFIKFEGLSMGGCSNGIEIEIKIECGAVTTKNFEQTELQFEKGAVCTGFEVRSFQQELSMCLRRCFSSYPYGTAPGSNVGLGVGGDPDYYVDSIHNQFNLTANSSRLFGWYSLGVPLASAPTTYFWDLKGTINACTLLNNNGKISAHGNLETYQGIASHGPRFGFQTGTSNYGAVCMCLLVSEL